MTGLDLQAVTVRYPGAAGDAVSDVSLLVPEGSTTALVGPSGCGKSSLLRAVAGLVPLASGSIRWGSTDLTATPIHERQLSLMFQHHALFSHRTVAQNVAFGLKMQGLGRAAQRDRVAELLQMVGLAGFGDRSADQLSGGEAQRVALARALAPSPRLLLLDEPLAALDRVLREHLLEEIRSLLATLGQTAIFVTHDISDALTVGDRLAVMNQGRLVRAGRPEDVWQSPQSAFVARFIGHRNVVDGPDATMLVPDAAINLDPSGDGDRVLVQQRRFVGRSADVACVDSNGQQWWVTDTGELGWAQPGAVGSLSIDWTRAQRLE